MINVLFEMQFLVSDGITPNVAIHFAMLNYLHAAKKVRPTATRGFAQIANMVNEDVKKKK